MVILTIAELYAPEYPSSSGLSGIKLFTFGFFFKVEDKPEYIKAVPGFKLGDSAKTYTSFPYSLETNTSLPINKSNVLISSEVKNILLNTSKYFVFNCPN